MKELNFIRGALRYHGAEVLYNLKHKEYFELRKFRKKKHKITTGIKINNWHKYLLKQVT